MSADKLERAREHCFMAGVGDTGMELCAANVPFGLAKIHHVQQALGAPPDAIFVGSPDATITRNNRRWSQGFGYGGVYQWSGDFTVLDIKPNACGMIVGAVPELPELEDVRARLHRLDREKLTLDGIELDNDLTESNHFVDVFTVDQSSLNPDGEHGSASGGAQNVFIMHSSGHEHRESSPLGPGLYWDTSEELKAMAEVFDTPWGTLRILRGDSAAAWYRFYQQVQDFNHRRREALARFLFGDHQVIINATHQGLVRGYNRANIGCYTFDDPDPDQPAPLFPLTLSPVLPAFLVAAQKNIGDTAISALGWGERLERHGLTERVTGVNLLPHGGGYRYPQFRGVARVTESGPDDRRFELAPAEPGAAGAIIETPRDLPYAYRGLEVKERMEQLDLGTAVVKLDLEYVLTA